jgi:hypothetical protein
VLLLLTLATAGVASAQAPETAPPVTQPIPQDVGDRARERIRERVATPERSRLRLFLDDAVLSPTLAPRLAFSAALDQRADEPDEWGRSAGDFGRRVAARAGLNAAQASVHHATAAMLRLEARDSGGRCHCGHPMRRTANALARTFMTRDDRGRLVPNVPLVAGAYGGALIATAWSPPSYRADREALRVASLTIVAEAGSNVFREFAPELKRLLPGRADNRRSATAP